MPEKFPSYQLPENNRENHEENKQPTNIARRIIEHGQEQRKKTEQFVTRFDIKEEIPFPKYPEYSDYGEQSEQYLSLILGIPELMNSYEKTEDGSNKAIITEALFKFFVEYESISPEAMRRAIAEVQDLDPIPDAPPTEKENTLQTVGIETIEGIRDNPEALDAFYTQYIGESGLMEYEQTENTQYA